MDKVFTGFSEGGVINIYTNASILIKMVNTSISDFVANLIEFLFAEYGIDDCIVEFIESEQDSWNGSELDLIGFVDNLKYSINQNYDFDDEDKLMFYEAIDINLQ